MQTSRLLPIEDTIDVVDGFGGDLNGRIQSTGVVRDHVVLDTGACVHLDVLLLRRGSLLVRLFDDLRRVRSIDDAALLIIDRDVEEPLVHDPCGCRRGRYADDAWRAVAEL